MHERSSWRLYARSGSTEAYVAKERDRRDVEYGKQYHDALQCERSQHLSKAIRRTLGDGAAA